MWDETLTVSPLAQFLLVHHTLVLAPFSSPYPVDLTCPLLSLLLPHSNSLCHFLSSCFSHRFRPTRIRHLAPRKLVSGLTSRDSLDARRTCAARISHLAALDDWFSPTATATPTPKVPKSCPSTPNSTTKQTVKVVPSTLNNSVNSTPPNSPN